MGYYFNLHNLPIRDLFDYIERIKLFPSHRILLENPKTVMTVIVSRGICDAGELHTVLKTKKKVVAFAVESGIDEKYLIVLRRFINGLTTRPLKLPEFFIIDQNLLKRLLVSGIDNTEKLFNRIEVSSNRNIFKDEFSISDDELMLLIQIADISRLRYVGPGYAMLLIEAGYDSIKKIKGANPEKLRNTLSDINYIKKYVKNSISLKDMSFLIADEIYSDSVIEVGVRDE